MGSTFCIELASASGRGYRLSKTAFSSAEDGILQSLYMPRGDVED